MGQRDLTDREADVMAILRLFVYLHQYPPTLRQIAVAMRIQSVSRVHQLLVSMRKKGCVRWDRAKCRTLTPVDCN